MDIFIWDKMGSMWIHVQFINKTNYHKQKTLHPDANNTRQRVPQYKGYSIYAPGHD